MASNVKYNCIEQYAKNNSWKFKEYTNECVIWRGTDTTNYFSFNQNGQFKRFKNSAVAFSGTWVCDGDSNFILTTTDGVYYSSDGFKRRNKTDDPTSTETTPLNPIFSCVEKRMKESGNIVTTRTSSYIIFKMENTSWAFNKFGGWQQIKSGKIQYKGKWGCDGESEYKIVSDDGEIYESKDRPTKWKKSSSSDGSTKPTWKETTLTIEDLKNGKTVSMGMKGSVIGEIQKLLISAGYKDISKSGESDNLFGLRTKTQVKKFQSENKDDKGEQLKDDGIVGTKTINALLKKSDEKMKSSAQAEIPQKLRLAGKEFGQIPKPPREQIPSINLPDRNKIQLPNNVSGIQTKK
jgi:hypothetical protein